MSKLFIIGNGFDLAHGLKTSYDDFRSYLIDEEDIEMEHLVIPAGVNQPDGGISYNQSDVLSLLFYLISEAESNTEKWSNIETSLGHLNFHEIFDTLPEIFDEDGDVDHWKQIRIYEDLASDLVIPMATLKKLFSKWISTVDTGDIEAIQDFLTLIDTDDQFLNFNYTDTLEQVYLVPEKNICYIHGTQYDEIYFGHGDSEDKTDRFMADFLGAENYLLDINEQLRKNTSKALNNNQAFFDNLATLKIEKIYSHGFSFNEVDKIYLEEICRQIDTSKITWYFHDYNIDIHKDFMNTLLICGYQGEFDTFHV